MLYVHEENILATNESVIVLINFTKNQYMRVSFVAFVTALFSSCTLSGSSPTQAGQVGLERYAGLKLQFFWPFREGYNIVMLADDYLWAVVAAGVKYLWILRRMPEMDQILLNEPTIKLTDMGYDMNRFKRTIQKYHEM